MVEFSKYYMDFIQKFLYNIGKFFSNLFKAFSDAFYKDIGDYIQLLLGYCRNNSKWTVLDWIALTIVAIINILFIGLVIVLIIQFFRRYLKFRKREADKDDLIEEVTILNNKVLELIDEKNKILAMKVSQLGLLSTESNIDNDPFRIRKNEDKKKLNAKDVSKGRFTKLTQVDEEYGYQMYTVHMGNEDKLTLPNLVDRFIMFSASQLRLYYSKYIVSLFIAGMATSKVLILEGISGTGKTSLPYAMGKFFKFDATICSVQPSWRDRAELLGYLNEFTKKFNETDFLRALYTTGYRDDINFIVLDEMNLARIEYYFAEFLSVMEMPDINEWKIDLVPGSDLNDPKKLINGKIIVPQNLWFVGTANKDDSTFTVTDKVYDRASSIEINAKATFIDAPFTEPVDMNFEYLDETFKKALINHKISDALMKKFLELDEYIQDNFKIAFGNRIMKQIKLFVPVFVACGNDELDGLDYMLARKILRKFESLNIAFLKPELTALIKKLDTLFGKDRFKVSISMINEMIKMN